VKKTNLTQAAQEIVLRCAKKLPKNKEELAKVKNAVCQTLGINTFPDAEILAEYKTLVAAEKIQKLPLLEKLLQKRSIRTLSGIAPISVLMPPAPCNSACVYCPTERADETGKTLFQKDTEKKYGKQNVPKKYQKPGVLVMPKSYISSEPGAMRALLAGFDPFVQITRRLRALKKTGHTPEKCELIVQGGTFSDVPKRDGTRFLTRCYQAFNTPDFDEKDIKKMTPKHFGANLEEAQKKNESAPHRVIGLTLETRPGCVTPQEIKRFRELGCTRVELGVQTLDDEITKKTRRRQTREEVVRATKLLRQAGFKICYHMMPGLPFSTPEKDFESWKEVCENPDFKPDLVKIYPCSVVPYSQLQKWHADGKYKPYEQEELFDLLKKMKKITPPWIRISRLIRDIPGTAILGGNKTTNLRQVIQEDMKKHGEKCVCIRCREVRDQVFTMNDARFTIRSYEAAEGMEHFLSYELKDDTLLAMLRLRIPGKNEKPVLSSLKNSAIIRELHTFGHALEIQNSKLKIKNEKTGNSKISNLKPLISNLQENAQHVGFGKKLVQKAEEMARENGLSKISVISGIGVKDFYRKIGFVDDGTYLAKML
jgi:elongator complex protein 3